MPGRLEEPEHVSLVNSGHVNRGAEHDMRYLDRDQFADSSYGMRWAEFCRLHVVFMTPEFCFHIP